MNQFWEMLSSIADVFGIVSAAPMLAAAVLFAHRARRYRLRLQEMEGQTTAQPIALAVSLTGWILANKCGRFS